MPTADGWSSRGDLAYALFNALGLTQVSGESRFSDGGLLGGVATTLADLGITNGVGGGRFGTTEKTTRGQAFTMIARALGLADANTDVATASQALVDAGIVKGYGNDPGNLGLNDPLKPEHLGMLMDRVKPNLQTPADDGRTIQERAAVQVDQARDQNQARQDPTYAAYLASIGVGIGQIEDEMALREELFNEDSKRRSESYQRATDQAMKGIGADFENRGLFRSGTRLQKEAERTQQIGYEAQDASLAAQRAFEENQRALARQKTALETERLQARIQSDTGAAERATEDQY